MGGARLRRGALPEKPHQRAKPARAPAADPRARTARRRGSRRLAADRNAADQPAARSLRAAAAGGHPLGRSFLSFAKRYCAAEKNEYGWKTGGASNIEELTVQLHGVMLRRSKDDVLALPPKLRTWLPVEVPAGTGVRDMRRSSRSSPASDEPAPGATHRRAAPARPAAPFLAGHGRRSRAKVDRDARLRQGARSIRARR